MSYGRGEWENTNRSWDKRLLCMYMYMYIYIIYIYTSYPAASLHCIYWFNVSWQVIYMSSLLTTYHWESGIGNYLMLAFKNRTQGKSRRVCLLIKLCEYLISCKRCLNVLIFVPTMCNCMLFWLSRDVHEYIYCTYLGTFEIQSIYVNLLIWCDIFIFFMSNNKNTPHFFFIIKNPFKSNKQPWNTTKKNSKDSNVSRLNSCRRIVYLYLSVSTGRQRPSCMSDAEIRQPRREPWRHCHGVPRTSGRGWKEAPLKSVRP